MFANIYKGKRVVVTGHTGFKGAWLSLWLKQLGAEVIGISKDIPTTPSMFESLGLADHVTHHLADIRDLRSSADLITHAKPDFVFHLAAQPIVSQSYQEPLETITSNVLGTAHVLESIRHLKHPCVSIIITSDKAYDNVEQVWGYKEDDALGGKDVYSGSKGAAELVVRSYVESFLKAPDFAGAVGIARAGNVIGGGDWAKDRIVVDCMRAWIKGLSVPIRHPHATRPWQHVLEPLSGYLHLGATLAISRVLHGEAFNFGPRAEQNRTVEALIRDLSTHWDFSDPAQSYRLLGNSSFHEASLLKLNCDKALFHLQWQACLHYEDTVRFTGEWYHAFYKEKANMLSFTINQISDYEKKAHAQRLSWTL